MKYVVFSSAIIFALLGSSCSDSINSSSQAQVTASEGSSEVVCQKSMPPKCFVDGKKIKTTPLGRPIKDDDGGYIFE